MKSAKKCHILFEWASKHPSKLPFLRNDLFRPRNKRCCFNHSVLVVVVEITDSQKATKMKFFRKLTFENGRFLSTTHILGHLYSNPLIFFT